MDGFVFPYNILGGRFLGSRDKVLMVGGVANHSTQIEVVNLNSQVVGSEGKQLASINISGDCCAMEICGVTRFAKSFSAVATHKSGMSTISLIEIQSDETGVTLSTRRDFERSAGAEDSVVTSLAYYAHQSQLGVATEVGDVIVRDIISGSETVRFSADYCGVNCIKFSNSGHVISLGSSGNAPLQVWDVRERTPVLSRSATRPLQKTSSRLTCLLTSSVNDYDMICGTSDGQVVQWDTRYDSYIPHSIHSDKSEVKALCYHPTIDGAVLSGSSDGVVSVMEYDCLGGGRGRRVTTHNQYGVTEVDRCLLAESSPISSIDIESNSRDILVTSKLGGATVLQSGY